MSHPEQLGPFRIERVLGRGGMGAVYEGVHVETAEVAAVKVLLSTLEDDDELRSRFEAEIDTLKRLRHPNIVRLYGFGEEQGMLYYVMELVDGPSLQQELKKHRLFDWSEVAKVGLEMCSALKHAHDRGITHRDIKPANILLEQQGTSKLSDYGIAQLFGGSHLTNVNAVVGTLEYMSPEQAQANPVGPRSDLYSLGAVLYAMLVGRPPLAAKNLSEILRKHQTGAPLPLRASRLDVPNELETIIFDLLKTKPEERPTNAYMAGKRFQSLIQALVGPPEKLLIKPRDANTPQSPPLGPIVLPETPPEKIGPARGIVTNGGIIDLGGIVENKPSAEAANTADHTKTYLSGPTNTNELLEQSFGPPEANVPDDNRLHRNEAEFLLEEYRRREIPLPKDVDALNHPRKEFDPLVSPKKDQEHTEEFTPHPKNVDLIPPLPKIRHGEIVLENPTGRRRMKDEPLPDVESFEALHRGVPESGNDHVPDDHRDQETTRWTDRQVQNIPPSGQEQQPSTLPTGGISAPFLEGPPSVHEKFGGKTKKNRLPEIHQSETDTQSSRSATRFVAVEEKDLGGFDETPVRERHIVSLQTILTSGCLVLIGLLVYYLRQPVSADVLFARIKETVQTDDSGEFSVSSLRLAERDIDSFLSMYSTHLEADTVRDYKDELILADKEQKLRRRQAFSKPSSITSAEWAYLEAISFSRIDPEKEMLKLRAIVDLFDVDTPRDRSINRRLSNDTERCVEWARRRLEKLETDVAEIQDNLLKKLEARLDDADRLQAENPKRAEEIRRGLIELYQDRPWAAPLIERAKNGPTLTGTTPTVP